nr:V4R domain-containing protein [Methanothermococcus thermolithotrophicus]
MINLQIQLKLNRDMEGLFREMLNNGSEQEEFPNDEELVEEVVSHLKKGFDREKLVFKEEEYTERKKDSIPLEFFRVMVYIVMDKIKKCGSEITLYEMGYEFGKFLNPKNLGELKKFFRRNNLGILKFEGRKPLILKVNECAMCDGLDTNEPICYFDAGLIAGALECIYKKTVVVDEIKCMSQGADACYFKVDIYRQ